MRSRPHPPSPPGHTTKRVVTLSVSATKSKCDNDNDHDYPPGSNGNCSGRPGVVVNGKGNRRLGHSPPPRHRRSKNKMSVNRHRKKTLFRMLVGGVLGVYLLFTFVLQPVVDVESTATSTINQLGRRQRGGRAQQTLQDDNKHSPLMLLREREVARRKIQEKANNKKEESKKEEEEADDEAKINHDHQEKDDINMPQQENGKKFSRKFVLAARYGKIASSTDDNDSEKAVKADNSVDAELKADANLEETTEYQEEAARIERIRHGVDVAAGQKKKKKRADDDDDEQEEKKPKADQQQRERILPELPKNAKTAPVEGDPLRAVDWPFEREPIDLKPAVEYLGTLVDAGRHYFPLDWLKRLVDRLADMNFNLIHFRLTDDQTFNVLLKSHPELAYPTAVDNPDRAVYTVNELKEFTAYAKERGIQIMPEVNVPGHAGAWAGIPDMIVHCPQFICDKGYGLPLNITHHHIKDILTDIIKEVVEIFDDPPFLHLGGDEVNMADPCFEEVGASVFNYVAFEKELKQIIKASGYPEDRIVRWEMTGQKDLDRAGAIEQFWESHPGDRHMPKGKFFVSTWLYFDTNTDQNAKDVYKKTMKNFNLKNDQVPTAIIAGTFELSTEFWFDRNVLGRLLSVAMGAANQAPASSADEVIEQWNDYCKQLGFGEIICDTDGGPVIGTNSYHVKWRQKWVGWKKDICDRLTMSKGVRMYKVNSKVEQLYVKEGNKFFWKNFAALELPDSEKAKDVRVDTSVTRDVRRLLKHKVPHTGVILDAVSAMPKISRLHTIINDYVSLMGFNLAQIRLVNNYGFVYEPQVQQNLAHSFIAGDDNPLYSLKPELEKLVQSAKEVGVDIMPEVSVSTDAGGWYRSSLLANCPEFYCTGKGTPLNLNNDNLLPILFSIIGELRQVFTSRFFHLGTDERKASMACFEEAKMKPRFEHFERKLETLMALANLAPEDLLRTENSEGVRYPGRAGAVTQYRSGELEGIRTDDGPFFLTVDLFDGDGYHIFESAKKAVALKPLGILAELRKLNESKWQSWSIPKRLLAFAMGVSEIGTFWSIYNPETFASYFESICQALELHENDGDCSPPGDFSQPVMVITESKEFAEKSCEVRTHIRDKRFAKEVTPFYRSKVSAQE